MDLSHIFRGGGKQLTKALPDFVEEWSGVVLLAEAEPNAGEKNYKLNRRKEIIQSLQLPLIVGLILAFAAYAVYYQFSYATTVLPFTLLLTSKLLGCAVSVILLWYEIDKANPLVKQICSMGRQTHCSAVLSSKQSKLFNVISWSEIGFFYFAGGLISLFFSGTQAASVLVLLAWLNVMALPYTFFSVYYQWKVAKQWCVLCLAVQAILITEFLIAYSLNVLSIPSLISSNALFITIASFLLPIVVWYVLKPLLVQNQEAKRKKRELLRLKYDTRIFNALLPKQKQISVDPEGLGITIGNPKATNAIIKVCNPYCGPCAKAHPEIDALLEENNDVKVQIIFTASNDEHDKANEPVKHLLAIAQQSEEQVKLKALDDWYLAEKKEYEVFAAKYPMNGELELQWEKVSSMRKWCDDTGIAFTPTFFINGYQLPDIYNVGDLKYLLQG